MSGKVAHFDEEKVDEIFAAVDQCRQPGAAVAVAVDGVPVYRKGFGLANMELPVLLGPSMRMRIGSTTKHFTALAYMLLCEEGKAGLDDPIGKHVPGIHATSRDVTMRRLMGHTSGIRDAMTIAMMMDGPARPTSDAELLAYYERIDDVDFAPGESWSYNNGGYVLLTAAIERITGETLDEVLRKRIFEPVGMTDTLLRRNDRGFVGNSATLHFRTPDGRFTRDYMGAEISGAGGIVSTMDDMLRWLKHMDAPFVGSAETWRTLREPQRLANGTSTVYGLGLVCDTYRGVPTISHGGGVVAGNSQMIKVPSAKLDISIAVNRADVSGAELANRIIDLCVEGLEPLPPKTPDDRRHGVFVSREGRALELLGQAGMQLMALDGAPPLPLAPDADGALRLPAIFSFILQSFRFDGAAIRLTEFGAEYLFDPADPVDEAAIREGVFRSDATDMVLEFTSTEAGPRLRAHGRLGKVDYRLRPVAERIWQASMEGPFAMLGGILAFDPDGGSVEFTVGRMRKLRFVAADG
ncbi:serine hydrolase domain-containing protein [Sphingomonas oryzagri]